MLFNSVSPEIIYAPRLLSKVFGQQMWETMEEKNRIRNWVGRMIQVNLGRFERRANMVNIH